MGIFSEICYDPSLGINIIPHFHVQGSSKNHLFQSQKHLRLPNGQVLDCSRVLQGVPMVMDDLKTSLDFHIFDLPGLSFHLTFIGRPIEQILENALGNEKLGHRIGKEYLPVWTSQPLSTRVESSPVLDPRGELKMISQTTMTYPSLEEDLECHEKESAHPLLEMENFINEHGSYPLILSSSPCSFEKSPNSIFLSTKQEIYNSFTLLVSKIFAVEVVDAFVYHKFSKSRSGMSSCSQAPTSWLQFNIMQLVCLT